MEHLAAGVVASVRRFLLSAVVAAAVLFPSATAVARPTDIMPASELAPGMKGYGFSDLGDGKGVQRFEVEIIGLLKSYAPKQDLILARVTAPRRSSRRSGTARSRRRSSRSWRR